MTAPTTPQPCPVCRGSGLRYDHDTSAWGPQPCIACGGSCEAPRQSRRDAEIAERNRELRRGIAPRGSKISLAWSPEEDACIRRWLDKAGDHRYMPVGWTDRICHELHGITPARAGVRTRLAVIRRIHQLRRERRTGRQHDPGA